MDREELWNWASKVIQNKCGADRVAEWDYFTDLVAATAGPSELHILIAAGLAVGAESCQRGREVLRELHLGLMCQTASR